MSAHAEHEQDLATECDPYLGPDERVLAGARCHRFAGGLDAQSGEWIVAVTTDQLLFVESAKMQTISFVEILPPFTEHSTWIKHVPFGHGPHGPGYFLTFETGAKHSVVL